MKTSRVQTYGGHGVNVKLSDTRTRPWVFWSPAWERAKTADGHHNGSGGMNSYVVVESDKGEFEVDGKSVCLVSINGIGEIRWDVSRRELERAIEFVKAHGEYPEKGSAVEHYQAARHFGLVPDPTEVKLSAKDAHFARVWGITHEFHTRMTHLLVDGLRKALAESFKLTCDTTSAERVHTFHQYKVTFRDDDGRLQSRTFESPTDAAWFFLRQTYPSTPTITATKKS